MEMEICQLRGEGPEKLKELSSASFGPHTHLTFTPPSSSMDAIARALDLWSSHL